jgi:uncharacterized protein
MKKTIQISLLLLLAPALILPAAAAEKARILIIDGQNNHDWRQTTPVLKAILEKSGRFEITVSTTPGPNLSKQAWASWRPVFGQFAAVLSNYNGEEWSEQVKKAFVDYVRNGGGFIVLHAADNSFPGWREYNEMIGVGGWGGRDERSGPRLYWQDGRIIRDNGPGSAGHHGQAHEYLLDIRLPQHVIVKGLPSQWLHSVDELYDALRGPAQNVAVLATAYSAPAKGGTGRHEPLLMAITYGQGRVFHDVMGHDARSLQDTGFQVTFARGSEWAATGMVTLPAPPPGDMPADHVGLAK